MNKENLKIFTEPFSICEQITRFKSSHLRFILFWLVLSTLISVFIQVIFFITQGHFSLKDFIAVSLFLPLIFEFSMSIVLDDFISFLFAGIISIGISLNLFFLHDPLSIIALPLSVGGYSGAAFCLLVVFGVFDLFKGKVNLRQVIPHFLMIAIITIVFSYLAMIVYNSIPENWTPKAVSISILIVGISWIMFSINVLFSLNSKSIVGVFLFLSSPPLVLIIFIFPYLFLFENSFLTSMVTILTFTIGFLLSFPLNYAGKVVGNNCKVDDERKIINPTLIKKHLGYTWIWTGIMVTIVCLFGFWSKTFYVFIPLSIISFLIIPPCISAIFKKIDGQRNT